jgi:hypothetical protein
VREREQTYGYCSRAQPRASLSRRVDTVVHVNPTLVSLLGRTAEESCPPPVCGFHPSDDRKKVMASHLQRSRGGRPRPAMSFRIFHRGTAGSGGGDQLNPDHMSGEPASLSFLNDITERPKGGNPGLVAA